MLLLAGRVMLQSGANASRIEETLMRLAIACGADSTDVFCTLTGLFLTVVKGDEVLTRVLSIRGHGTDLGRIAEVYGLSRELEAGNISFEAVVDRLKVLILHDSAVGYSPRVRLLGNSLSSGAFAVLLGGGLSDFLPATLAGLFAAIVHARVSRSSPDFVAIFFAVITGTLWALAAAGLSIGSLRYITVGVVMPLVPGLALTNSVRDLIFGDLISGLSRGAEAVLSAAAIAGGVYTVLVLFKTGMLI